MPKKNKRIFWMKKRRQLTNEKKIKRPMSPKTHSVVVMLKHQEVMEITKLLNKKKPVEMKKQKMAQPPQRMMMLRRLLLKSHTGLILLR